MERSRLEIELLGRRFVWADSTAERIAISVVGVVGLLLLAGTSWLVK